MNYIKNKKQHVLGGFVPHPFPSFICSAAFGTINGGYSSKPQVPRYWDITELVHIQYSYKKYSCAGKVHPYHKLLLISSKPINFFSLEHKQNQRGRNPENYTERGRRTSFTFDRGSQSGHTSGDTSGSQIIVHLHPPICTAHSCYMLTSASLASSLATFNLLTHCTSSFQHSTQPS